MECRGGEKGGKNISPHEWRQRWTYQELDSVRNEEKREGSEEREIRPRRVAKGGGTIPPKQEKKVATNRAVGGITDHLKGKNRRVKRATKAYKR